MEYEVKEQRLMSRPIFGLYKLLHKYKQTYLAKREMARRAIEQDARRYGGEVKWND